MVASMNISEISWRIFKMPTPRPRSCRRCVLTQPRMKISDQITSSWDVAYGRCSSRVTLPDFILNVLSASHEHLSARWLLGNLVWRLKKLNQIFCTTFTPSVATYECRLFGGNTDSLQHLHNINKSRSLLTDYSFLIFIGSHYFPRYLLLPARTYSCKAPDSP